MKNLSLLGLVSALVLGTACGGGDSNENTDGGASDSMISGDAFNTSGDGGNRRDGGNRDAGSDGGAAACFAGLACNPAEGANCPGGGYCYNESTGQLGAPSDPIYIVVDGGVEVIDGGGPDGGPSYVDNRVFTTADPVNVTFFEDGYCMNAQPGGAGTIVGSGSCDPETNEGCAEGCEKCTIIDEDNAGQQIAVCLAACDPAVPNSCRPGYSCDVRAHICYPGCGSDTECRTTREDTNRDGEISRDVVPPATTPADRLIYDTASAATCNNTTYRCDHPGTTGAHAGIACTMDSQCEANGDCFPPGSFIDPTLYPDGLCTKFACNVPGRECAAGGTCVDMGGDQFWCLASCQVGAEMEADRLGTSGHGAGCAVGETCGWDGKTTTSTAGNGGCFRGNYNAVTTPNIGSDCSESDDCYSPFGQGGCFGDPDTHAGGWCSINNCAAPGMPSDVCGSSAMCVSLSETQSICLETCTTGNDCHPGHGCVTADMAGNKVCFPICGSTADCPTGETCVGATADAPGQCEPS